MSDDKQGASVGQASPPAGERVIVLTDYEVVNLREALTAIGCGAPWFSGPLSALHSGDWTCQIWAKLPVIEKPLNGPICQSAEQMVERALSHAGRTVEPEQADVAVLPRAVSLSGLEQTVEAMAVEYDERLETRAWARIRAKKLLAAALSTGQIVRATEPRNHAPWCRWEHEGSCPAENEPAPDHPVWAEVERLRAIAGETLEALGCYLEGSTPERLRYLNSKLDALRAALSEGREQ